MNPSEIQLDATNKQAVQAPLCSFYADMFLSGFHIYEICNFLFVH